ncbi:MAG: hypothetical protein ACREP6_06320 [Candidatus Binataceae bacterium]
MKCLFNSPHRIGGLLAAGAALASWMLLAPPPSRSGVSVDVQASLSQWLNYGSYDSLNQCARAISNARNGAGPTGAANPSALSESNGLTAGRASGGSGMASNGYNGAAPGAEKLGSGYGPSSGPGMAASDQGGEVPDRSGMPNGATSAAAPRLTQAQLSSAYCVSSDDPRFKDMIFQQAPSSPAPKIQQPLPPMPGEAPGAYGGSR